MNFCYRSDVIPFVNMDHDLDNSDLDLLQTLVDHYGRIRNDICLSDFGHHDNI
jgi:hypothetical protein